MTRCTTYSTAGGRTYGARCILTAGHDGLHAYTDTRCREAMFVGRSAAPVPCILERDHVGPHWAGPT